MQTGAGGASAVSLGHSPADGVRCTEVPGEGSPLHPGSGWLMSLSLGTEVGERGAEMEGEESEGGASFL